MKRSRLFAALCSLVAVLILAGVASSAPKKRRPAPRPQDTITFEGNLTLSVNGRNIQVKGKESIPMPETFTVETQDDHPTLMVDLFKEEGALRRKADVLVRTSRSFTVSGARVISVSEITTYRDRYTDPQPGLVALKGRTIPAKTGDYYIGIELSRQDRERMERAEAAVLRYLKIHVEAAGKLVGPAPRR